MGSVQRLCNHTMETNRLSTMSNELYILTNNITGKKYIGQACSFLSSGIKYGSHKRWISHKSRARNGKTGCPALYNAIIKYNEDNFSLEILLKCDSGMIDYYEKLFIDIYDTISPNGYNLESGGKLNTNMNDSSKDLLSQAHRFRRVNDDDLMRIRNLMSKFGIDNLPRGFVFSHDTKIGVEGFSVSCKGYKASFLAKNRSLEEKFKLALDYYNILISSCCEIDLGTFNQHIISTSRKLISQSKRKIYHEVELAMKELGIVEIPMYIQYEKRMNRFNVKHPDFPNKYIRKNTLIETLKEAINYLNMVTSNGNRSL